MAKKVSKELIEFKKIIEEDEIETTKKLNLEFLINYVYKKGYIWKIIDTVHIHYII